MTQARTVIRRCRSARLFAVETPCRDSWESASKGRNAVPHKRPGLIMNRRAFLTGAILGTGAAGAVPFRARAQSATSSFEAWRDAFRARAAMRGVSDATYARVMGAIKPDT